MPGRALGPARRRLEALAISALGGLLLWASTSYPPLGPLLGLAYAVLMAPAVFERWRAPITGFLPGCVVAVIVMQEPLSKWGVHVQIALSAILVYHYAVQAIMAATLRRFTSWPVFVILPVSIGFGEWLRHLIGVGEFNFYMIGTYLAPYPVLIQGADLVGGLGLSVVWSLPFAVGLDALRRRIDGPGAIDARTLSRGAIAAGLAVVALVGYGVFCLATIEITPGPRVAVIQPSEDHAPGTTDHVVRVQQRMTVEHVAPGEADLIAWPENAILDVWETNAVYREVTRFIASSRGAPLLFGTMGTGPDGSRPTNTTYLVDGEGTALGRYDKVVLFPFTERRFFPGLERISPWARRAIDGIVTQAWGRAPHGWAPDRVTLFRLPAPGGEGAPIPFWTPVCYESNHGELAREAGLQGARFFVNLTSEGWLGWAVSHNQMFVNTMRAVEHRVGLVRVGNTGPSAFVLPNGRVEIYLQGFETGRLRMEPGVLIHRVALGDGEPTLYARLGAVLDPGWGVLWVVLLGVGWLRRRNAS